MIDPGRFDMMTNDYTAQITQFKQANAEICTGVLPPPVFSNFWQQAVQQGYRPKICTMAKADLFPAAVNSYGERGAGADERSMVVALPPVQVEPYRTNRSPILRRVGKTNR